MKRVLGVLILSLAAVILSQIAAVAQSITISGPTAGDIIQHASGYANVAVQVSATGVPSGGGVEIVLDLGTSTQMTAKLLATPYIATFNHVQVGEHTLDAWIIKSSGSRLSAHDRKERVGVGDILVAVGDSITAGEKDDISSDDWSSDGRNGPVNGYGGFEPILNNLLSGITGYPNSVRNEGLSGETTAGAKTRIAEIIGRHPTALTWLVAYGTNDSSILMSAATFRANLENLIAQIQSAIPGAVVFLPRVLYNGESRKGNYLIQPYDQVMDELSRSIPGVYRGADLDTLFHANHLRYDHKLAKPGTWLSTSDTHHPNGLGFQKYAMLWKMALVDQAMLVTDGYFSTLGDLDTDKVSVEGLTGIGLGTNNLFAICDRSGQGAPPAGATFVGDWRVGLMLTGANSFGSGSVDVTLAIKEDNQLPPGVSWRKVWLARDNQVLPTAKSDDADDPSIHYFTSRVTGPGQISPVLAPNMPPPVTKAFVSPSKPNGRNNWYTTSPKVTLTSTDYFGCAAERIMYRWDSGSESTYKSALTAPGGKHTLTYYAVDAGDNAESPKAATLRVDTTAASKPTVQVSSRTVKKGDSVTVSWYSRDGESGIDTYRYAIGTSAGRSNVRGWTSVGVQTKVTWKPTGAVGAVYYFTVDVRNRAGTYSERTSSQSITITK